MSEVLGHLASASELIAVPRLSETQLINPEVCGLAKIHSHVLQWLVRTELLDMFYGPACTCGTHQLEDTR